MEITIANLTYGQQRNADADSWTATARFALRNVGGETARSSVSAAMQMSKRGEPMTWPQLPHISNTAIAAGELSDPIEVTMDLPLDVADLALASNDRILTLRITMSDASDETTSRLVIPLDSVPTLT